MITTPMARELVEMIAIAASPFMRLFSPRRRRKKAAATTTGIATANGAAFIAVARARAPKPTWESPSPIMEYRFNTRLTPSKAAQTDTREPTIKARTRKV
jgi:hypothetical protein